jgi:hypothetical protein
MCKPGTLPPDPAPAQRLRAKMLVRRALVDARTGWINQVRGILRGFGYRVAGKHADNSPNG